jgi:hypothetical protein
MPPGPCPDAGLRHRWVTPRASAASGSCATGNVRVPVGASFGAIFAPRSKALHYGATMRLLAMTVVSLVSLVSVSGAIAAPAATPRPPAPTAARRLPAPEHVDTETQREVKARMGQHGSTMEALVRAVIVLDRPTIRVLATRIADEEVAARAGGARDKQRSSLPAQFFAQQDELAIFARQLAVAAHDGGDDKVLAEHFSAVMRTCVGCHSTYLHDRPGAQPGEPKGTAGAPGAPPSPAAR